MKNDLKESEVSLSEAKAKENGKFNIQTFETLSVAHFAYLSQTTALRYVTLLQRRRERSRERQSEKRRNRGRISISINTVVQMNPFVGEI